MKLIPNFFFHSSLITCQASWLEHACYHLVGFVGSNCFWFSDCLTPWPELLTYSAYVSYYIYVYSIPTLLMKYNKYNILLFANLAAISSSPCHESPKTVVCFWLTIGALTRSKSQPLMSVTDKIRWKKEQNEKSNIKLFYYIVFTSSF